VEEEDPYVQQQKRQRAQALWNIVANEVKAGKFLLHGSYIDPSPHYKEDWEGETAMAAQAVTDTPTSFKTSSSFSSASLSMEPPRQEQHIEHRRNQVANEMQQSIGFTIQHCILAILVYLIVSIVAFSFIFDHWTIIDSIYFAMVTFTTIGYGDIVPTNYISRIFTIVYAFSGVAFLGIALGILGTHVVEAEEQAVQRTSEMAKTRVMAMFASNHQEAKVLEAKLLQEQQEV
jgi:hypothetical protein